MTPDRSGRPTKEGRRGPRLPGAPVLQRGVIILPSAFTLGNLFFGLYAVVAATRGDYEWAGWFIIIAGILDMLDGRVARFTRTGSAFGAELDSLVDAVSFGVAPSLVMYHLFFTDGAWSWTVAFVYVTAVVVRLARFNVEQAGRAKSHFNGLPSPTAGMLLASYFPFTETALFQVWLSHLPWAQIMAIGMVLLGVLMVSQVPYAVVPRIGIRTWRARIVTVLMLLALVAALSVPRYFFFLVLLLYTAWGLGRSVTLGLLERIPEGDPLLDPDEEEMDDGGAEVRALDYTELSSQPPRPSGHGDHPRPSKPSKPSEPSEPPEDNP